MRILLSPLLVALFAFALSGATRGAQTEGRLEGPPPPPAPTTRGAPPPVSVFAELDGTWAGTFVGYDAAGKELYRINVRQTYETVSDTVQRVTIDDEMPDGTHIFGRGQNTARRGRDGALVLKCIVTKSNGERVEHDGRLIRGPDGARQLVWYSRAPDRVETFREVVRHEGETTIYEINGMGRYGESLILMHGLYRKQPPSAPPVRPAD